MILARHPDIATMERSQKKRGERVYVDTGQTGARRAIVAPYSVRAAAGATVSTPLFWEELSFDLDPRAFTMKTVPFRVATSGDPMRAMRTAKPDVAAAITALSALVGKEHGSPRG
jgi:bifunctional non-homologous end joining protein LigD